ncbi:MAG: aromatic-ring-hydroxylating dioxygenase subunit beta [Steroidobacteraceae bacterium]
MLELMKYDNDLHCYVRNFLNLEAEFLDDKKLKEWLALFIDEAIHYIVPVRLTRMLEDGSGFDENTSLQDDDFPALRMRVNRLKSTAAWSENPPTRLRHFITNIRLGNKTKIGNSPDDFQVEVKSNVLVFRSRGESPNFDLLSAERHDTLRQVSGEMKILRREVLVDHTTIPTNNFAFFF